jgi:hypothetical protein
MHGVADEAFPVPGVWQPLKVKVRLTAEPAASIERSFAFIIWETGLIRPEKPGLFNRVIIARESRIADGW